MLNQHLEKLPITLKDVEELIELEYFVNEKTVILGVPVNVSPAILDRLSRLIRCTIILKNGMIFTGENISVSPSLWDPALGKQLAREAALEKIYQCFAFHRFQTAYDNGDTQ